MAVTYLRGLRKRRFQCSKWSTEPSGKVQTHLHNLLREQPGSFTPVTTSGITYEPEAPEAKFPGGPESRGGTGAKRRSGGGVFPFICIVRRAGVHTACVRAGAEAFASCRGAAKVAVEEARTGDGEDAKPAAGRRVCVCLHRAGAYTRGNLGAARDWTVGRHSRCAGAFSLAGGGRENLGHQHRAGAARSVAEGVLCWCLHRCRARRARVRVRIVWRRLRGGGRGCDGAGARTTMWWWRGLRIASRGGCVGASIKAAAGAWRAAQGIRFAQWQHVRVARGERDGALGLTLCNWRQHSSGVGEKAAAGSLAWAGVEGFAASLGGAGSEQVGAGESAGSRFDQASGKGSGQGFRCIGQVRRQDRAEAVVGSRRRHTEDLTMSRESGTHREAANT
ncbi:hypothetical protein B0H13DRAFT_2578039 [Mycena leptocephala]|nr:hypothetical protein B0H13DRAFT_2578039 [Mycena leptocephala]